MAQIPQMGGEAVKVTRVNLPATTLVLRRADNLSIKSVSSVKCVFIPWLFIG
jgi:hypothetical protein